MSRLDQEPDVVALARELGLRGDPVEAVVRFCEERIGCWAADVGGVDNVAALEQLVADHLQLAFEGVCSDDDLKQIIGKYVAQGEYVFATLRDELGPAILLGALRSPVSTKERWEKFFNCWRNASTS